MRAFGNTPQRSQTDVGGHRQSDLVDHLAGVPNHDRCAQDVIVAFASVDRDETAPRAVGDGPINVVLRKVKVLTE